ncbi:MAG: Maf-like protein [Pseudomonadales bacterium]|nr:Maf-like protein [Pseudomonadales bacterium]
MYKKIVLASGSPRRRELLTQIGVFYEVQPVDIDESELFGEAPDEYVRRLAIGKAAAGWDLKCEDSPEKVPVLGSDTTVVFDDQTLGKPEDEAHALAMLQSLSASTHWVMSAVAMQFEDRVECRLCSTEVRFKQLTETQIKRYWATGEPADKAGAYGIQGFGAIFVEQIQGSYSNVVGLPLKETAELLDRFDVSYWQQS